MNPEEEPMADEASLPDEPGSEGSEAVPRGRRPILDEVKRSEVLAILSVGCSRSVAARYVGCSSGAIADTARRDPAFDKALRRKEQSFEVVCLQSIRNASREQRYWRAAVWALERMSPEKYARRGPDVITLDQIRDLLKQFGEIVVEEIPVARYRKRVLKRLDAICDGLKDASGRREPRR